MLASPFFWCQQKWEIELELGLCTPPEVVSDAKRIF